jgi:hypothetical protein
MVIEAYASMIATVCPDPSAHQLIIARHPLKLSGSVREKWF